MLMIKTYSLHLELPLSIAVAFSSLSCMVQVLDSRCKAAANSPTFDRSISPGRCNGVIHPLVGPLLRLCQF